MMIRSAATRDSRHIAALFIPWGLAWFDLIAVGLIVVTGLALRLYGLTNHGIWYDEGYHLQLAQSPTITSMLDIALSESPSDPLYPILLRGWIWLFGYGDAAVRSLSVLLGTATLPATYWLGRLMSGRSVGLLAAALFAISPYALEFGQEATPRSLTAFTTTMALAAGWRWFTTGRGMAVYALAAIAAIYSHYAVAVILGLFGLLVLGVRSRESDIRGRDWLQAHLFIFGAWVPWLAAMVTYWLSSQVPASSLVHAATWDELLTALVKYTSGTAAHTDGGLLLQMVGLLTGVGLFAVGLVARGKSEKGLRVVGIIAAVLFFVPALISAVTGWWIFVPHFMFFLLPALLVVLAAGAISLWEMRSLWKVAAVFAFGVFLAVQLTGAALFYRFPPHGADGLREIAATLRDGPQDELVLVTPPLLYATLSHYYHGTIRGLPSDFDMRAVYTPYNSLKDWSANCLAAFEKDVSGRTSFWLLYRPEFDTNNSFLHIVQSRYHQELSNPYEYAVLYKFSRR